MINKLGTWLAMGFAAAVMASFGWASWLAASDLCDGFYLLPPFEKVHHAQMEAILKGPDSIHALLHGPNARNGSIVWNLPALIAAACATQNEERIIIMGLRLFQAALFMGACGWLCWALLAAWPARALGLAILLSLPGVVTFTGIIHTVPLQLLCLAAFLWKAKGEEWTFGWHWLFLGLAFGIEVSTAPIIALFLVLGFMCRDPDLKAYSKEVLQDFATSMGFFLLGWFLAAPSLLAGGAQAWSRYADATWLRVWNATGGPTISDWLRFLFLEWSAIPIPALLLIALASLLSLSWFIWWKLKAARWIKLLEEPHTGLLLALLGLLWLLPIILIPGWDYSLYPAVAILLLGQLNILEDWWQQRQPNPMGKIVRNALAGTLIFLLTICTAAFQIPDTWRAFQSLATRSQNVNHRIRLQEREYLTEVIAKLYGRLNRELTVVIDPTLYPPPTEGAILNTLEGASIPWSSNADLIALHIHNAPGFLAGNAILPDPNDLHSKEQLRLAQQHLATLEQPAASEPSYILLETPSAELILLARRSLFRRP